MIPWWRDWVVWYSAALGLLGAGLLALSSLV